MFYIILLVLMIALYQFNTKNECGLNLGRFEVHLTVCYCVDFVSGFCAVVYFVMGIIDNMITGYKSTINMSNYGILQNMDNVIFWIRPCDRGRVW